ncbi:hypothetical protein L9F63_004558, partial [Diploptera punctata]
LKTHQVLISRSPHLYMSPSSHCDDIKAMNNFLPSTLEENVVQSRTNFIGPVGRSTILLENDIRTLCRFTLPDKLKVASSEKKILVMNSWSITDSKLGIPGSDVRCTDPVRVLGCNMSCWRMSSRILQDK